VKASPEFFGTLAKKLKNFEPRVPRLPRKPLLPVHRKSAAPSSAMLSQPRDSLVSGWDDVIDLKAPTRQKSPSPSRTRSPTSTLRSIPTSLMNDSTVPPSPRSPIFVRSEGETIRSAAAGKNLSHAEEALSGSEDNAFSASTIQYLHSPTAHSLGLQFPIVSPPSPVKTVNDATQRQPSRQLVKLAVPQTVPDDVESTISSIFDAPWPQPPHSPPPFTPRTGSLFPALSETVYGEHDDHVRNYAIPFRGPGIRSVPESTRPLDVVSRAASPTFMKAKKYLRREAAVPTSSNEAVYMTVVQETT
jgi:pheromone a factor receptor